MSFRVTIFRNGSKSGGKVIRLPATFEKLLEISSSKLNFPAKRVFDKNGSEIDEISVIRDEDVLYFSSGDDCRLSEDIQNDWVSLNVGGCVFTVSRSTLTSKEPCSMLARMFSTDSDTLHIKPSRVDSTGAYLIDRSPTYFEPILNYLRHGKLVLDKGVNPLGVLEEAQFFGIDSLTGQLEVMVREENRVLRNPPLNRQEVIRTLIQTDPGKELRFQGVNLAGADLSKLDLRNINFKYASLQGCRLSLANLSWCNLERADLSGAVLDGAQLLGVRMLCASLEGASLRNCNFEDPAGSRANMEGVNMKSAVLSESNMAGVNLRVATLKHADLRNCVLRGAVLAGADLEGCDLSGSDLQEANLRGANLKDATLELMLNPLHMSQAIR